MDNYSELFSPIKIGPVKLKNRIIAPPMVQVRPITSGEGIAWYKRLAGGRVSMVIVEATGVPGFDKELTAETLRPLVDAIHNEGAAAAIQLFPIPFGTEASVDELSFARIDDIVEAYGRAASICRQAGFDGVEPHGAHGYLLNQFLMPDKNHRTDEYGGSLENRGRLACRIARRIKQAVRDELLLLYRHSPDGPGYGMDESLELAEMLVDAGVDVMDISPAMSDRPADLAEPFKTRLDVPIIAVKGMQDPTAACEAIAAGRCDMVALGRHLIADAHWPRKVAEGKLDDILRCVECNKGCFDNLRRNEPVVCVRWDTAEVAAQLV